MADISEFNINNTLYNLKDTQARNNIISLSNNFDNYLPLSGGTLTGSLTTSLQLTIKDNTIDTSISSESDVWPKHLIIKDKDNVDRGYLELYQNTPNIQGIQLETKRIINDENVFNGIRLGIDSEGNRIIHFTEPTKWRIALGANSNGIWPESLGGTGETSLHDSANALINSLTVGSSVPTPDDYLITQYAGGNTTNSSNANANKYYRRKISLVLNGFAPTITTGTRNTSNTSAGTINIYKFGKVIMVHSYNTITTSAAIASGKSLALGTVPSGYRPDYVITSYGGNSNYPGQITINTSGNITYYNNVGSDSVPIGTKIHFCATYIIE